MNAPPNSIDAENAVLGAILLDDRTLGGLELEEGDFYNTANRYIFRAMLELEFKKVRIDAVTLTVKLGSETEAVGALEVSNLLGAQFAVTNIEYYAAIVKEKSRQRKLVLAASEIAAMGMDSPGDDYFEVAGRIFFEASQGPKTDGPRKLDAVVKDTCKALFDRLDGRIYPGVKTGFPDLDLALTGGLQLTDLLLLAARPAMGKTALAISVALNAAQPVVGQNGLELGHPVIIFSLEMGSIQLTERMIAVEAQVNMASLKASPLREDVRAVVGSADKLLSLPIELDDTPGLTLQELRARARRWGMGLPKNGKPGLVVVDYIQLLRLKGKGRNMSKNEEVSELSRGLKELAKELHFPVLALAQLNRAVEYREDKRPILADLRDSGSLEQDADVIMFLYRDEVYRQSSEKGKAEILVRKHRNGACPIDIPLLYDARFTKFKPYSMAF